MWRTGPGKSDRLEDEWLNKAKLAHSRFYTIEIKNKGIGTSRSQAAKVIELEGNTFIKDSLNNILRIAYHNHEPGKWLGHFNQTRWLDQIATLLE